MLNELLNNNYKLKTFDKCEEFCNGAVVKITSNSYAVDIYDAVGYEGINTIEIPNNLLSLRGRGTIKNVSYKSNKGINIHDSLEFNGCAFFADKEMYIGEFYRTFSLCGNADKFTPIGMNNCTIDVEKVYVTNYPLNGEGNTINAKVIDFSFDCDFPNVVTQVIEKLLDTNVFLSPYCWEHGNPLKNINQFNNLDWDKLLGFIASSQDKITISYVHNGSGNGWKERYKTSFVLSKKQKDNKSVRIGNMWIVK